MAQRYRIHLPMQETQVGSLGREDPLEEGVAARSSTLAWRIPGTEEPGGLQSTGSQRVEHDGATKQEQRWTESKSSHCEKLLFSLHYLRASASKMSCEDSPYEQLPSRGWPTVPTSPQTPGSLKLVPRATSCVNTATNLSASLRGARHCSGAMNMSSQHPAWMEAGTVLTPVSQSGQPKSLGSEV